MARLVQNYGIFINAEPTAVYDYLADFTKHGSGPKVLTSRPFPKAPPRLEASSSPSGNNSAKMSRTISR